MCIRDRVGTYQWKGDIDLANIVLIGLAEDLPEKEERYEPEQISDILDMEEMCIRDSVWILPM